MGLKGDFDGVLHPGALLQPIEEDHPGSVHSVLHLGLVGTPTDQLLDLLLILPGLPQVWQLARLFLFPFCKKICLEGKSMTPRMENILIYSVFPGNSFISVSDS